MFNRDNIAMSIAFVLSVGLHSIVFPKVYSSYIALEESSDVRDLAIELPIVENSVELGIDDSETSTLTWIGYKEYEKHLARHAEVEQAEMNSNNARASSAATQWRLFAQPMMDMTEELLKALRSISITIPAREIPNKVAEEVVENTVEKPAEKLIEERKADAIPGDRDSEATSIIEVSQKNWESGKPLAAEGLVLRPVHPTFTSLQRLSIQSGTLVASLFIDRRGIPMDVVIHRGTSSRSINQSLKNSLYRWTASGEQIEVLDGEDTIEITIRILIGR
jgi:hypothetical protein